MLCDAVFDQAVNQVDIVSNQLVMIGNALNAKGSIVDEELQIEVGDVGAGVALAGVVENQSLDRFAERDVGVLDLLDERLPLEKVLPQAVADNGVAGQARDDQRRAGVLDQQLQQGGQRLLGVLQLGFAQVLRIPGDIGDQQITFVGF